MPVLLQTLSLDQPAEYHIEVIGRLDPDWSANFGGMDLHVDPQEGGVTITHIVGKVADQAGLHGLLRLIRDLGLPLIRVEYLPSQENRPQGVSK
jgi:hypothetical protein